MSRRQFSLVPRVCWTSLVLATLSLCAVARTSAPRGSHDGDDTRSRALPAYAVASRADLLVNSTTECGKELHDFRDAVDRRILWSLKMLDASGGPEPGFIYGNNFWLGSRSQCHDTMNLMPLVLSEREQLNNTLYRDPEEEFPPFRVNYFVAHLRHNSTLQYHVKLPNEDLITLGLCLPASCTMNDLSLILRKLFRDRVLLIGDVYSADFRLIEVRDLRDDHRWLLSGAIPVIGVVLMLTWSVMIIATIYDLFVHQRYLMAKRNELGAYDKSDKMTDRNSNAAKSAPSEETAQQQQQQQLSPASSPPPPRESRIARALVCFSVYTNTRIVFSTRLDANSVSVIHGLRFLGMGWIIMIHTVFFLVDYGDNKPWAWRMSEGLGAQVISNSTLSVDTYFFLSGFLVAYLYLRDTMDKERTKPINYGTKLNEFFVTLTRRFIRLTPAYMMMLGIVQLNASWYGKTSQFYMNERPQETCAKYWWRNLLYINNLFSRKTMCMSWSWYLANDMQFFVIGSFLLILSSIYFYTAVVVLGALLLGSIVLTGYISYVYEYVPTLEEQYRLLDVLYDPPWTRIGPYIIGIITAYIILKLNRKLVLKTRTVILCWCLGSACNVFVLFGLYKRHISVLTAAFYVALSRTVWAIGLAWILIACCTKNGGIINQFLSFRGWVPLSRLTYCAYLLNPFVINSVRLHSESSAHVDFLPLTAMFLGNFTITYFCAYALSLMAETPYVLLMRMFIQSRGRRK